MKISNKFILSLVSIFCGLGIANAYDFEVDGIYYSINVEERAATVTSGDNKYVGEIAIPSYVSYANQEIPVTSIRNEAFSNCIKLISIEIPPTITSIGSKAFNQCDSLVKVNITDLVSWCSIEFNGSSSNPLFYAHNLYLNNIQVKDLVIPPSITSIRDYTFVGSYLETVEIPNTVTSIGTAAFYSVTGLFSIKIPDSVQTIGENAFHKCSLKQAIIGDSVTFIGYQAFMSSSLESIKVGKSVTSFGLYAFEYCNNLSEVIISDIANWCKIDFSYELTTNYRNPLYYAKHLYLNNINNEIFDLVIPNTISFINYGVFFNCESINKVEIPENVTEIYPHAFYGCSNLRILSFDDGKDFLSLNYNNNNRSTVSFRDSPIEEIYLGRNLYYRSDKDFGYSPFYYNTELKKISLGKFVTDARSIYPEKSIGLEIINCYNPEPPSMRDFTNIQYATIKVNIPKGSLEAYKEDKVWGNFWNLQETLPDPSILTDEIVLNLESAELNIGDNIQLEATVLPEDATDKTISWLSSNENVATVSDNGLVTAISAGETIITATCGEVSAYCEVTVTTPIIEVAEIILNLDYAELNIGEIVQLEAVVLPEVATDKSLSWNSSNPNVATVSAEGLVTAISLGNAIITVRCGDVSAECVITVLEDAGVESLLTNPENKISVYSTDGILIKKDCKVEDLKTLAKGIYIIVSGKEHYKISI